MQNVTKDSSHVVDDTRHLSSSSVWSVINARSLCNKLDEFHLFLSDYDVDVCCVTETWLTDSTPDSLICHGDYTVYRHDRITLRGGVAIFVKAAIHSEMVAIPKQFESVEIVCVDLIFDDADCRVICLYRKPGFSDVDLAYINDCVNCLRGLCSTDKLTVIVGDCNLPDVDWLHYHAPSTPIYNIFLDFVNNYGFHQYVNQPTRNNNILDIVMATSATFLSELFLSEPLGTSDHNKVIFRVNAHAVNSPEWVTYYDFVSADYNAINQYLSSLNWNEIFSHSINVDDSWSVFSTILHDVFIHFVPIRSYIVNSSVKSNKIRYPRYIRRMIHNKAILWKRWKISGSTADSLLYKSATANCSTAIRKFHAARETAMIRKNNLGSFYNYINAKSKSHPSITKLKNSDGSFTSDVKEVAETFNSFFSSVFTHDDGHLPHVTDRNTDCGLSDIVFTPDIIKGVLRKLKPTTSAGHDGIPNIFLKNCALCLSFPLSHIFDISFKDGHLPDSWKFAMVTPVHKKGPISDPNNFRPISLTATCCKVMERVINNNLLNYLLSQITYH